MTQGDSTVNPTLLVSQTVSRGKTTTSLYDFKITYLVEALSFKDGSGVGVYYQTTGRNGVNGNAIVLIMMAYLRQTDSLTINEVLNDEAVYDLDLDGDGNIGDTISAVYMNVPDADAAVENLRITLVYIKQRQVRI